MEIIVEMNMFKIAMEVPGEHTITVAGHLLLLKVASAVQCIGILLKTTTLPLFRTQIEIMFLAPVVVVVLALLVLDPRTTEIMSKTVGLRETMATALAAVLITGLRHLQTITVAATAIQEIIVDNSPMQWMK